MSNAVIKVENLSKSYTIRHQTGERYTTLRDVLTNGIKGMGQRLRRPATSHQPAATSEEFWALNDVSFEVKQGERVGIIGRNGAGKSTLLKILSRITEPTKGRVHIKGRVASLLEVGTGFHPELTGRENIYLNGAILGMSREEIRRKFDEIVAFAEVEKFLDTPVKRYSSGMYVRLAFAVAAHLEPEILVVDEVLAVGDSAFQKKCMDRMKDVGKGGGTVIFVSHNMDAIQSLCNRALAIEQGRLSVDKPSAEAIKFYLHESSHYESFSRTPQQNGSPTLTYGKIQTVLGNSSYVAKMEVEIQASESQSLALDIRLKDELGVPIAMGSFGAMNPSETIQVKAIKTRIKFNININNLANGSYLISLDLTIPGIQYYDRAENCLTFEVQRHPQNGAIYVLPQSWRYGCFELPLTDLNINTISAD